MITTTKIYFLHLFLKVVGLCLNYIFLEAKFSKQVKEGVCLFISTKFYSLTRRKQAEQ